MTTEAKGKWFEDQAVVIAFARILVDSQGTLTADDVIRYFEKPWKWTDEHARWVAMGSPDVVTVGQLDEPDVGSDEDETLSLTPAGQAARTARLS